MSHWYEAMGLPASELLRWPYPVRYGVETEVVTDVLVLGGGPAGVMAAISAAKAGVTVALVEKSHPRSGGGTGVDHWLFTPNPCSKITPEECALSEIESYSGYSNGLSRYIASRESYDTLLEIEQMGGKIRDTQDKFKGAPFRNEDTKYLFCYDYENNIHFRVWGTTFKPAMYKTCKKLGVQTYERVMVTSLLTENGRVGARVVGATGVHVRTGEFFTFHAKAVITCLSCNESNWGFSSELTGLPSFHPNVTADGPAIAWKAGAEFALMEKSCPAPPPGHQFPSYGTGNGKNTWYPCSLVDANGKAVPWEDFSGRPIHNIADRTRPAPGQKFIAERCPNPQYGWHRTIADLPERIKTGEFMLPLYADLPGMPEHERKVIWGLMIGEEGRTQVPVFETYNAAGFNPNEDMLQSYHMLFGEPYNGMMSEFVPQIRGRGPFASPGGLVTDWNLMTNLEGLFAAGNALYAANYYHHAATTGRYAGRKAAEYVLRHQHDQPRTDRAQITNEMTRVYAPVSKSFGMDWKELRAGLCRVMQNYCGEIKNAELLKIGKTWLADVEANTFPEMCAANPHQLMRVLESMNYLYCDELILSACEQRKASSKMLGFIRQDFPANDPPEWHKFVTVRRTGEAVKSRTLEIGFWGDFASNYAKHNGGCRS